MKGWHDNAEPSKSRMEKMKPHANTSQVYATISFPSEVYEVLEMIAKEGIASLGVWEATEKYIKDKWPLFCSRKQ